MLLLTKRIFSLILLSFFFVLILGGCMEDRKLINGIHGLGKLDKFESRDVSHVVANFIPLNTEKKEVLRELYLAGMEAKEIEREIPGCSTCEPLAIVASYVEKSKIPFLPDRSYISIIIGFKNGRVAHIAASHSGNPF